MSGCVCVAVAHKVRACWVVLTGFNLGRVWGAGAGQGEDGAGAGSEEHGLDHTRNRHTARARLSSAGLQGVHTRVVLPGVRIHAHAVELLRSHRGLA